MKFKAGDKVRVLKTVTDHRKDYVGKVGTITEDTGPGYRWLLNISDQWLFKDDELELVSKTTNVWFSNSSNLPKQIFFNNKKKTTVLKWEDDSITKVKCHDDEFDERTGFLIAYFQKTCGLTKNKANKYLESLVPEDKPIEEEYEIFIEENDTPIEILDTEEDMVFSVYKFLEEKENNKNSLRTGWPQECDGKTREECGKLDFGIYEDWLVPRSQYKPYKEN